jgi:hypothetical protein
MSKRLFSGHSLYCTQIGLEPLVATSTANAVAVLRTLPAIIMSVVGMGVDAVSASPSTVT